jgi:hypothetical protein
MRKTAIALTLLLSACVEQPVVTQTTQEPVAQERTGESKILIGKEQLIAIPPSNWQRIFQVNTEATRLADYIPPDQTENSWTAKLSFESFATEDLDYDPLQVLDSEAKADRNRCTFVQQFNVYSGYENNYETAVQLMLCGENAFAEKGEVKLIKVIRGIDYYYAIRILRRIDPFEVNKQDFSDKEIALWSNYLAEVSVCDDTVNHPCPASITE